MANHILKLARIQDLEVRRLADAAIADGMTVLSPIVRQIVKQFRSGELMFRDVPAIMEPLRAVFLNASTVSHMAGRWRVFQNASNYTKSKIEFGLMEESLAKLQGAMKMTPDDVAKISVKYGENVAHVWEQLTTAADTAVRSAIVETHMENLHIREASKLMRTRIATAGLDPMEPYLMKTLLRTQLQLGYGAGRWEANQHPAIQEILWGYTYVTVGDDRVRPNHEMLDGTTRPKDDGIWWTSWPPNGYNCRCSTIELFEPAELSPEQEPKEFDDGSIYRAEPDPGWAFNPGLIISEAA